MYQWHYFYHEADEVKLVCLLLKSQAGLGDKHILLCWRWPTMTRTSSPNSALEAFIYSCLSDTLTVWPEQMEQVQPGHSHLILTCQGKSGWQEEAVSPWFLDCDLISVFLHSLSIWSNRICGMVFGFNLLKNKEKRPHGEHTSKWISAKQILKNLWKIRKNEIEETNMGTSEKSKAKTREH